MINSFKIPNGCLESIDLSGNDVMSQGCKHLNILAQRIKTIKSISVDNAKIECSGLSYLWICFNDEEDDLKLDFLSAKGNKINIEWALRLNFKLTSPLKVKNLSLGNNLLGDKGAKELLIYFKNNAYLETLDLS